MPPQKRNKSPLLLLTAILIGVGLTFISISSLAEANSAFGDKFFFIKKQGLWLCLGLIVFCITSNIKIDTIKKISSILYISSLICLILVFVPQIGSQNLGAKRWINLGVIGIQPSEILKFTSIIYFSFLFSRPHQRNIKTLVIHLSLPFILIMAQPNLSTAILVSAIVISIYYLAGGKILPLFTFCLILTLISTLLIFISPYRNRRLQTLLSPQQSQDESYHHHQIVYALASGGWMGKGVGSSDQKYRFIPKISTDSILAVIGEETGFFGLLLIFYLYLSLINHLFRLSSVLQNQFHSLICAGIACWIAYQSLINVGAIVAIIPLTGVPLPFISYGGSSLLSLLAAIGIVRNIEKQAGSLLYSVNDKKDHRHHRKSLYPRH